MESKDYQRVFNQSSAIMVIVNTDYTVTAASEGFLKATLNERENITGRRIFDVFPEIGENIEQVLINTMRDSFDKVLKEKNPHTTSIVRFDIPKEDSGEDAFDIRYWKAINTPIFDEENKVKFIKQIYVDVTDSRELSAQLELEKENLDEYKTAEEYIRSSFKQAPVPICVLRGPKHLFELVNEEFLRMAGEKKYIGKSVREALPELEGQGFFEILDQVYETEKPYVGNEMPITFNQNGQTNADIYVDMVYQILYDAKGNKEGVFVLGVDVTDRVVARKKLEESETRFRTLIEKSTVATALYTGPEFIVQYANDKMLNIFNKDDAIFGKPLGEAVPDLKGQPFLTYLKTVYETGETYVGTEEEAELSINGKPQTFYFNYTYTALRDTNGEVYGILNTAIDVTEEVLAKMELEKRENILKQLLNSVPQKISHTDEKAEMTFFNQQWIEETGYTLDELKGNGWLKAIHPEDTEEAKENWDEAIQSGTSVEGEYRIINRYKGYRWNLNRAVPIKGKNGDISMWVDTNTDIHDQKKQEEILEKAVAERTEELKQANNELIKQNNEIEKQKKEMEAFTYISSHDLQEPLRKIQIFAGRIRDMENQNFPEKVMDYFERIEDAAERMQTLIEDLLSFLRMKNDDKTYEKVDLNHIIEDVKSDLREVIEEKKATVEVAETCQAPIKVFQFRQLMKNLISNALKFSKPDTPPKVVITGQDLMGEDLIREIPPDLKDKIRPEIKYCRIRIKDNGIGFDPSYRERIFEVFQRLHTRDEYTGTGIGLAIVKKIVENHDGVIVADSKQNKGACFDIYIPSER